MYTQSYTDFGLFGGMSYYQGDINLSRLFYFPDFAYGGFIRYVFHSRWAVRGSIFTGGLNASDKKSKYNYQRIRDKSFTTPIVDITVQIELNFFPYFFGTTEKLYRWTPYVLTGCTYTISSWSETVFFISIPFGIGVKFNISKKLALGLEWAYRKALTDKLDNLYWYKKLTTTKAENYSFIKQIALARNTDFYSFIGIFFTYKFQWYVPECHSSWD